MLQATVLAYNPQIQAIDVSGNNLPENITKTLEEIVQQNRLILPRLDNDNLHNMTSFAVGKKFTNQDFSHSFI